MNEPQLINDWSTTFSREYKMGWKYFWMSIIFITYKVRTATISDTMGSYLPDYDLATQANNYLYTYTVSCIVNDALIW